MNDNENEIRKQVRLYLFEEEEHDAESDLADSIIEELLSSEEFQNNDSDVLDEETVQLLKNAFLSGFLASSSDFNGKDAKMVYRNSALKPGGVIWNEKLKRNFKRFLYNTKRRLGDKHD